MRRMSEFSRSKRPKRTTIFDVARAAGVSHQTVSRAMNDMSGISEETKQKVLDVAARLGYRRSRSARALVKGDHPHIGLVVPDLTNPYFPEFAGGVIRRATALGWNVLLCDLLRGAVDAKTSLDDMTDQVDAVIGYLPPELDGYLQDLWHDIPVVAIEERREPRQASTFATVEIDFRPGADAVVRHLRQNKRHRLVMIDSPDSYHADRPRTDALRAALNTDGGADFSWKQYDTASTMDGGFEIVDRVLAEFADVDAILAFNDIVALGVLRRLTQLQVNVPKKCAVIGIDGLQLGSMVSPSLTSLELDKQAVGAAAVDALVEMFANRYVGSAELPPKRTFSHNLVTRESS